MQVLFVKNFKTYIWLRSTSHNLSFSLDLKNVNWVTKFGHMLGRKSEARSVFNQQNIVPTLKAWTVCCPSPSQSTAEKSTIEGGLFEGHVIPSISPIFNFCIQGPSEPYLHGPPKHRFHKVQFCVLNCQLTLWNENYIEFTVGLL